MAFTKTPMQDTAQTKSVSLMYKWDSRDDASASYDTVFKNALVEPIGEEYFHILKRYGTEQINLSPAPVGPILGIYYWARPGLTPVLVVVSLDAVGVGSVSFYNPTTFAIIGGTTTPVGGLNKGDNTVLFQEFLYQSGAVDLMFTTGLGLFKITSPGVTTGPIANGSIQEIAYLDGYAVGVSGSNIINSNLNDPTTWTPANFLAADSYADTILKIARVGPYIVAFGSESIQYFYDAANPTGTPFAANVGATKHIGYLGGLTNIGDDVYFVGTTSSSNPTLYKMTGLKVEAITTLPFSRFWVGQGTTYQIGVAPEGAILDLNGHNCYYVRTSSTPFPVGIVPPNPLIGASYYFDLETQMWSKIGYQQQEFYLVKTAATFSANTGVARMTYVNVLGNNALHRFSPTIYQDDGANFQVRFRTKSHDFGTHRVKFGARLLIAGDQTATSSLANISWSDDDYKTFSTPRPIDMQYAYQQLYALGSFRKRSFTMTYSDNFPMRWQTIELDYDQGSA